MSTWMGGRNRKLSDDQEQEVCRLYSEGGEKRDLESTFGISRNTVNNILDRNGIEQRPYRPRRLFSKEQEKEICRRAAAESATELGREFRCSPDTVRKVLERNGMETRDARRKLTDHQEEEIRQRYSAGESTTDLGREFSMSQSGMCCVLKRIGVKTRSVRDATRLHFELHPRKHGKRRRSR